MKAALNATIRGQGPAVVWLHPMGLDLSTWDEVAARFEPRFTFVAADLPGHGRSPLPAEGAGIPKYATAVKAMLDDLGLNRPVVVGGSFGGMIALTLALNHPGTVKALVVSACPHGTPAADRAMVAKRGEDGFSGGMASVVEATLTRWFTPGFRHSATVQEYRRRLLAVDVAGWKAGWRAISTYDVRARLPELDVPVLCVAGRDDASVPLAVMQEMAREIPDARITVIDRGPHMLHIERPDAFSDAIAGFLTEQTAKA
jgi:3-oxoadipate enol-lactonase